jgi:hypothetical protein
VRAALAALVPVGDGVPVVELVRLVAAKLDGHGAHCAVLLNPPRGSLSPECVRVRCASLLLALDPAECRITVGLLVAALDPTAGGGR